MKISLLADDDNDGNNAKHRVTINDEDYDGNNYVDISLDDKTLSVGIDDLFIAVKSFFDKRELELQREKLR